MLLVNAALFECLSVVGPRYNCGMVRVLLAEEFHDHMEHVYCRWSVLSRYYININVSAKYKCENSISKTVRTRKCVVMSEN